MTNIERFESLLLGLNQKRDGMEDLLAFIRKSDMYTAPASTKYHSCHEGGLLEHSLNVRDCLFEKKKNPIWKPYLDTVENDSLEIVSLLHDVCKTYLYEVDYKNQKVYSENGTKSDEKGKFDWKSVPYYKVNDRIPLGHGSKSVIMIQDFIKLKPLERYAILYHMGYSLPKEEYNSLNQAIKLHPLVLALHESDLEATYLLEKEE